MNPIKLLIDARVVSGEAQGSATYLKGLYNSLQINFGETYELYFAGYDFPALKQAFPFVQQHQFIPLKNQSKIKLFAFEFPKIIKEYNIQFAHFQYVTPFLNYCKYIVTTHDVLFNDFPEDFPKWYAVKRNFLFKRSLKQSEIRLTVSNYSRQRIAQHYDIRENSIEITPNAVRLPFFEEVDKELVQQKIYRKFNAKNYLLYVSRIEPRKNHQLIIDAYRDLALHQQDVQLIFIGNDTLESTAITEEIAKMQADFPNHFQWLTNLSDEDLLDFYRGARLFLYPSKAEGFGIPPIEAAAAGVNTLCAHATAMKDFDFFGENFFQPDNTEEFQHKLLKNLVAPPNTWELNYIRGKVKRDYSWKAAANILHQSIQLSVGTKSELVVCPEQQLAVKTT